jgi:prepilin-type N-terminal cleavage/methylation domain-containing protein
MQKSAFTLIELSLVLVIIGLVVSGILFGKDLIHAAEIRAQIKQINDYQLAVNTFQSKYNCLAGDCDKADQFWSTAINGNGNGRIDAWEMGGPGYDGLNYWSMAQEMPEFFIQLGNSGLIREHFDGTPLPGVGLPKIALNPAAGFFIADTASFDGVREPLLNDYVKGTNWFWLVGCAMDGDVYTSNWDNSCAVFKAIDLFAIDTKMDDGNPLGGKFYGFGGGFSENACLNIGLQYDVLNQTPQCQAAYMVN